MSSAVALLDDQRERLGERVAEARRTVGLSQKALARRLGLSLWTLDQVEAGRLDAREHLDTIALATKRSLDWFDLPIPVATAAEGPSGLVLERRWFGAHTVSKRNLVLGSFALLVVIRFFTEVAPIIPRAANFIDIPIFIVLSFAALASPAPGRRFTARLSFTLPVFLFLALCAVSVVLNLSRVQPAPALVFLYGFLAPVGIYAAVYRLWPAGQALALSRLLVALGLIQLLTVFAIDLPRFISHGHNPDLISGTFGTNAYQLVFFLLVFTGLLAGVFTHERSRSIARAAPILFVLVLLTVFLAQYRALLVTAAITVILIGRLLGTKTRGVITSLLVLVSFAITLSYVASYFPALKFGQTLSALSQSPTFYASQRLHAAGDIANLYTDDPAFIITGTGPGTFSSRAWSTFAQADSTSASNVQGPYAAHLTGGRAYQTDVSDKYVLPRLRESPSIGGSGAVTSPFSSYTSLMAEVGLFGFLLILMIYVPATLRALRMAARPTGRSIDHDPLPALSIACAVAFTVLIQMALLQNWLEVTRITFIAWALLAVTTKECAAREAPL